MIAQRNGLIFRIQNSRLKNKAIRADINTAEIGLRRGKQGCNKRVEWAGKDGF